MSRDPGPALVSSLLAAVVEAGCAATLHTAKVRDWASATFVGHRHRVTLDVEGAGTAAWLAALRSAEWELAGHLVADLDVGAVEPYAGGCRATIHVLTLRLESTRLPSFSV